MASLLSRDQQETIAFLRRSETYGVSDVRCLETHSNFIFLAGADAYKIKRAVCFAYMDFSTLEKRRAACFREIEINRRWAPDLYLGCVAITRQPDGTLAFEGPGEIVEWAVHMRRFEQDQLLSERAERHLLDPQVATQLADAVLATHSNAERAAHPNGAIAYRDLITSICAGLTAAGSFDPTRLEQLTTNLKQQLASSRDVIDERAAHGFVRRCHGDLHLANIVWRGGRPMLYDAIEFDEALATIDTLYDLAFLLMDLDFRGHRQLANILLNRYLSRSKSELDLRGLAALPLFLSLRAAVRALAISDRAAQEADRARDRDLTFARRYLAAAAEYAAPTTPGLIVVAGLSGTGKTTVAAALAPCLGPSPGAVHLRSDVERKVLAGVSELTRLPASAYTPQARQAIYRSLHAKAATVLGAHHSVILDAVYDSESERCEIEHIADALNVHMHGLWLCADAAKLVARVEGRRGDASDATADVVRRQLAAIVGDLSDRWQTLNTGGELADSIDAAMAALAVAGCRVRDHALGVPARDKVTRR